MPSVAVVYHSGYGHTKVLAEAVARGAASVDGAKVQLVDVDDVGMHWDALHAADAIVCGSPTYMGSVSAKMKAFMEATSKHWIMLKWRDKIAGGFTNSASQSGDKLNTLIDFVIFAMQHGMIWMGLDIAPGNNSSTGSVQDLNRLGAFVGAMAQSNVDEGPGRRATAGRSRHRRALRPAHRGGRARVGAHARWFQRRVGCVPPSRLNPSGRVVNASVMSRSVNGAHSPPASR
jgi:NAD(P)H dehydrogenase (quinone)